MTVIVHVRYDESMMKHTLGFLYLSLSHVSIHIFLNLSIFSLSLSCPCISFSISPYSLSLSLSLSLLCVLAYRTPILIFRIVGLICNGALPHLKFLSWVKLCATY
ncbi:hypothetical protein AMTRI_Chr06g192110 [Amborella trichopoda]